MHLTTQNVISEKYIRLSELKATDNKILYKFEFSDNLKNYFLTNNFEVEYDVSIKNVEDSILSIPALSFMIPIAWPTGADIYLEKIDKTYFESIHKIGSILKKWYPKFPFSTKIYSKKLIRNTFKNKEYALLFSGGVDSLSSYIRHKERKPILISVNGFRLPLPEYENYKKLEAWLGNFVKMENLDTHFIKTNYAENIKRQLLTKEYRNWFMIIATYSPILLGLCAPLTAISKIGTIFIASSHTSDFQYEGFHPLIDNQIRWGDIKVIHDGYELSRLEKIKCYLKNYPKYHRYLRACSNSRYLEYNCGNCEKCLRTITSLILEDQDPKEYNFKIGNDVIEKIENILVHISTRMYFHNFFYWKDVKKHIPEHIDDDKLYNSKRLFESLRKIDFPDPTRYEEEKKLDNFIVRIMKKYYYFISYFGIYHSFKLILRHIFMSIKGLKQGHEQICNNCGSSNPTYRGYCTNCNTQFPVNDSRVKN